MNLGLNGRMSVNLADFEWKEGKLQEKGTELKADFIVARSEAQGGEEELKYAWVRKNGKGMSLW